MDHAQNALAESGGLTAGTALRGATPKQPLPALMEPDSLLFLVDNLRSRAKGCLPDGSVGGWPELYSPVQGRLVKDDVELQIDRTLGRAIPAIPRNNKQRLQALNIINRNAVWDCDEEHDRGKIDRVIREIHERRPQFRENISADILGELYDDISCYQPKDGPNGRPLPGLEVLAHRADDNILRADKGREDTEALQELIGRHVKGKSAGGAIRRQVELLRRINRTLDRIVPDGAYYNKLRQYIVDQVLRHGREAESWSERRGGDRRRHWNKLVPKLNQVVRKYKWELAPQAFLKPQDAVLIARAMKLHAEIVVADRGEWAKILGRDTRPRLAHDAVQPVHADLRASVQRTMARRKGIEPIAGEAARRVLERFASLFPMDDGYFVDRCVKLEWLSRNRGYWLDREAYEAGPGRFARSDVTWFSNYNHAVWKERQEDFQRLAREIDAYHQIFDGTMKALPPPELQPILVTAPDAASVQGADDRGATKCPPSKFGQFAIDDYFPRLGDGAAASAAGASRVSADPAPPALASHADGAAETSSQRANGTRSSLGKRTRDDGHGLG